MIINTGVCFSDMLTCCVLPTGPVELKVNYGRCEIRAVNFSVDLDSVYKTPTGDAVYALDKVDVDERNIWQLVIVVTLADGSTTSFPSKGFRIRTKPKAAKQDCHETGTHLSKGRLLN